MADSGRLMSLIRSEYYIVHWSIILSYLYFRTGRSGSQVSIKNPFINHPMLNVLHSSSFDTLEMQVLTTLLITAAFRMFRVSTLEAYMSTFLSYCQLFVIIITGVSDPVVGIQYAVAILLAIMLMTEPTYTGADQVTTLTPITFHEITKKDNSDGVSHVVLFHANWSSRCRQTYCIFAELSNRFTTNKIAFSSLDVGAWPREAKPLSIDTSAGSAQLPTVILFEKGHEVARLPVTTKAALTKATKRAFTKHEVIKTLELDTKFSKATGGASSSGEKAEPKKTESKKKK